MRSKDRRTGVVGARPVSHMSGDTEPVVGAPSGLAHGTWPGWRQMQKWGIVGYVNGGAVLAAVTAAHIAAKERKPLGHVHVGHLLAELDRCASAYYGERDGNTLLKDMLSKK